MTQESACDQPHQPTPQRRSKPAALSRSAPPENPFIFTKLSVFMQRIGDATRSGHLHYVAGSMPLQKVPFVVQKFSTRYLVNAPRMQDHRARQAKQPTARWVGYLDPSSNLVHWYLFYMPGKDICREERWKNPFNDRIQFWGFELIRQTKEGAKKPVITWRFAREKYHQLRDEIVFTIRGRQDARLDQIIHSLSKSPGFAGIRAQVKDLHALIKSEWKLRRAKAEEPPKIPQAVGYVRRLPDVGAVWSELMQSTKKGKKDGNQEPVETPRRKARRDSLLVPPSAGSTPEEP